MPCVLLEVRRTVETEVERCNLPFARRQQRANFIGRPYIKLSLFAFAVGVEARPERAIRRAHLAYEPADDGARNGAERRLARCASQIGVERDERPVVVEHLLEMWNRPFGVNAVAAETTAEMIIDAAFGHPRERRANDRQRFRIVRHTECPQAELKLGRMREFGRTAEAAVNGVEAALQFGERNSRRASGQWSAGGLRGLERCHRFGETAALLGDRASLFAICPGNLRQDIDE